MGMAEDADLVRIERVLNELSEAIRQKTAGRADVVDNTTQPSGVAPRDRSLAIAQAWLNASRLRDEMFGADLFSDPAWVILLHLFIGEKTGQPWSISSLCVASNLAQSTGLRWLLVLEKTGQVRRQPDSADRRKISVSLTSAAITNMEQALA